jgi:hypothetical protein
MSCHIVSQDYITQTYTHPHLYKDTYRASTSGLLCRSTTCDAKLRKHNAASNVVRIAFKYGCNVVAYSVVHI